MEEADRNVGGSRKCEDWWRDENIQSWRHIHRNNYDYTIGFEKCNSKNLAAV